MRSSGRDVLTGIETETESICINSRPPGDHRNEGI
jgi:hypothetical protein